MQKLISYPLILIIILFIYLSTSSLTYTPPPWPDEALYMDIARNFIQHGKLGSDLLKGFVPGAENYSHWSPPFFLIINSLWLNLTGFTLTNQRLMTVLLSAAFLLVFYLISVDYLGSKNTRFNKFLPLYITALLIFDDLFLKTSRLSRPEMLILLLSFSSYYFYLKTISGKAVKRLSLWLFLSGLLLGLATTTHLITISFLIPVFIDLLLSQKLSIFKFRAFLVFLSGLVLPISIWILSILPSIDTYKQQFLLIINNRIVSDAWLDRIAGSDDLVLKTIYIIYFIVSGSLIILALKSKKRLNLFFAAALISVIFFALLGKIYTYHALFIPFIYLGLGYLLKKTKALYRKIFLILSLVLLLSNIYIFVTLHVAHSKSAAIYSTLNAKIISVIPPGKSVYLSSIPDTYFLFEPGINELREFPALKVSKEDFEKVLDQTDFIVFSGFLGHPGIAEYLNNYIINNIDKHEHIALPNDLTIDIIELKSRQERAK